MVALLRTKGVFSGNLIGQIPSVGGFLFCLTLKKGSYEPSQCLSQDLETGCLKLAVVKSLGVQIFKGDHNILIFQP